LHTSPGAPISLDLEHSLCSQSDSVSRHNRSETFGLVAVAPGLSTVVQQSTAPHLATVPCSTSVQCCTHKEQPAMCALANDGVCDELTNRCKPCVWSLLRHVDVLSMFHTKKNSGSWLLRSGTDAQDCADACMWANDGVCDELKGHCKKGTDSHDCNVRPDPQFFVYNAAIIDLMHWDVLNLQNWRQEHEKTRTGKNNVGQPVQQPSCLAPVLESGTTETVPIQSKKDTSRRRHSKRMCCPATRARGERSRSCAN